MLIRFVVSNFMSFKEETEFNMLTSKGKGYQKHMNHVYKSPSNVDILKTAAIYGANSSGKSNLIKAIAYLKNLVVDDNSEEILMPISKRFRIDKEYKNLPTSFRIEYIFKNIHFDYGIEISKGKISEEWLYCIKDVKKENESLLFKRKGSQVTFGDYFKKNEIAYLKKFLEKELFDTQSVLSASFKRIENNDTIDNIYKAFKNLIIVLPDSANSIYTASIIDGQKPTRFAEDILKNAQTGIEKLVVHEMDADNFFSYDDDDFKNHLIDKLKENAEKEDASIDDIRVLFALDSNTVYSFSKSKDKYIVSFLKTQHFSSNELFELEEESDGTNRLFELAPAFDHLINDKDLVFLIDELERSLHPILAKELMRLFSKSNTSSSQLIFTTHESHLLDLDLFRQDEIWFSEKKLDGSSVFYPLSKFKPREDKDIRKGYLQGRYGGIPFLGDFTKIVSEN